MPHNANTAAVAAAQSAYGRQARQRLPTCGGGCVIIQDDDTRELIIVPITCKKWTCSYCAPAKLWAIQLKARRGHPERHIVLTMRPDPDRTIAGQLAHIRSCFRRLVTVCRKTFGTFEYLAALELHKSGAPHLHILQRGTYISHRWLSRAWKRITGSYIVHIKQITNSRAAINEITKYLAKTACNINDLGAQLAPFTMSNGWLIDKPDVDPDHAERNFTALHSYVHVEHLQEALERCGVELVAVRGPPGRYRLDDLAHATPTELQDLRDQAYHEEDTALALAVSLLTDPNYVSETRLLADYHKDYPQDRTLDTTGPRFLPELHAAA